MLFFYRFLDLDPKWSGKGPNEVIIGHEYSRTPYGDFWTDSGIENKVRTQLKIMTRPEATKAIFLAHSGSVQNLAH